MEDLDHVFHNPSQQSFYLPMSTILSFTLPFPFPLCSSIPSTAHYRSHTCPLQSRFLFYIYFSHPLLLFTSFSHFFFPIQFLTLISHFNFPNFHITVHFPHWKHRTSTYCTSLIGILSTFKKIPLSLYPQGPRFPR